MVQIKHSKHSALHSFAVTLLNGIAAYYISPKKRTINIERNLVYQLTIF